MNISGRNFSVFITNEMRASNLLQLMQTINIFFCAPFPQRIKNIKHIYILINDIIIEQVTYFKYLGYRISEYESDLEDKLQTYNKINGAIRRHFGKQMNKETNLMFIGPCIIVIVEG